MKAPLKRARSTTSRVWLEVLLGLAGEADDDVGGDRGVRDGGADPVDDAEVPLLAVGAPHRLAARGREPDCSGMCRLGITLGVCGHRLDDVVGELGRVRAGEPHPLQSRDVAAGAQQLAERLPVAELHAVGVDVLAEQGDLADALGDQGLDLAEDLAGSAVLLLAAQRRDDAERAGVVAADAHRHPGGVRRLAAGRERAREDLERLEDLDLGLVVGPAPAPAARAGCRCCGCRRPRRPTAPSRVIVARSFCARQPPTAICMPGRSAFLGAR